MKTLGLQIIPLVLAKPFWAKVGEEIPDLSVFKNRSCQSFQNQKLIVCATFFMFIILLNNVSKQKIKTKIYCLLDYSHI